MAKKRYINTKFWNDTYVSELGPLERYVFLYFLTNEHTDICGIYEVPMRTILFEIGLKKESLEKILSKLTRDQKVFYINGWVYIKNFSKHQAVNDNMKKGIDRSIAEIPSEIMDIIKGIESLPKTSEESGLFNLNSIQSIPTPQAVPSVTALEKRFNEFWKAYPKKRSNGQALKAWNKIKPDEQLHDRILKAVERAKTSEQWTKDFGQFIPYPATWLNAQGWKDDIAMPIQKPNFIARPVVSDEARDIEKKRLAITSNSGKGMQLLKDALPENLRKRLSV